MSIARMRIPWTGTAVVGPGLTTFFCAVAPTAWASQVSAFLTAVRALVPGGVTWQIPNTGDIIDEATGALTGTWSGASTAPVTSGGNGTWQQGVGARISWQTGSIVRRRRVHGSTFLVPMVSASFNDTGVLTTAAATTIGTAANDYLTAQAGAMRIWTRPGLGGVGVSSPVTGSRVPIQVSWLRSRRT